MLVLFGLSFCYKDTACDYKCYFIKLCKADNHQHTDDRTDHVFQLYLLSLYCKGYITKDGKIVIMQNLFLINLFYFSKEKPGFCLLSCGVPFLCFEVKG